MDQSLKSARTTNRHHPYHSSQQGGSDATMSDDQPVGHSGNSGSGRHPRRNGGGGANGANAGGRSGGPRASSSSNNNNNNGGNRRAPRVPVVSNGAPVPIMSWPMPVDASGMMIAPGMPFMPGYAAPGAAMFPPVAYANSRPYGGDHSNGAGRGSSGDNGSNGSGAADSSEPRALKVSAQSNPKAVAGCISHTTRNGTPPSIQAAGPASLNQVVKSIAIARSYLVDDKVDLIVYPSRRGDRAVTFTLQKVTQHTANDDESRRVSDDDELKVAQASEARIVAGSIAGKIRSGHRVAIVAIGPVPVSTTVCAIAYARDYLAKDQLDVSFRPEFVHLDMDNETRSGIRFTVLSQQI